ncbi:MAG TPA: DUF1552 domain-containing protein [Planctomycetota bacterium]
MHAPALDRRTFLRGAGVSLALPLLEGARRGPAGAPRRLAILALPFGMVEEWFHPTASGRDYALPPSLAPLADWRARITLFSNLDHGVRGGHAATHTFLSGVKSTERASNPEGNLTLDQRVAEVVGPATRFPALVLWDAGTSFTRNGVRVPCLPLPSVAFRQLFVEESAAEKRFERAALDSSASILDAVRSDARALAGKLGQGDRERLDEYLTSVRETEARLAAAEQWLERPRPPVDDPAAPALAAGERDEPYGAKLLAAWLDVAYLALRTDSTRVLSVAVPNVNWGLDGVSEGYHPITHHGQREERLSQLRVSELFVMTQLARFLARLDAAREADGSSLLDATQVLFGSGMSNGNRHTNSNLPLLLAGGRFRHGQHLDCANRQPLCNLYLTMLNELGIEDERFNKSTGRLDGLAFG